MPSRERQIKALMKKAKEQFVTIESEYKTSLMRESISEELKINIKNMCENLRSALDYLAHDIRETYCPSAKKERFYFPILPDITQFRTKISVWYPGLETTCSILWSYLENLQPYHGESTTWLRDFNRVNNENKHECLVPQTKSTREEIRVTSPRGKVSWNRKSVRFGKGVFIHGVPVDPSTQMPIPHPSLKVERIIWVDFHFEGILGSVLVLLRKTLIGVEKITSEVRTWL